MSSKTFLTISKEECLVVYKDIINNSDNKWASAKNLTDLKDYGASTAMAIISIEELVKSIIVFLDGKGFEFRTIKGIGIIFRNHQIRHLIAFAMFVVSVFGDDLFKFLAKIRENPNEIEKFSENFKKENHELFERKLKFYLIRKIIRLKGEFDWFSQADIFRQDGFYCDYDESLKTPISISAKNHKEVIHRLEKVREVGKAIIEAYECTDEITVKYLKLAVKECKKQNLYFQIGNSLASVRQTRTNPFHLVRKSFFNGYK
ncbi:MAG: AbiV family abortive infection protein [Bacteroidetes bacterium]|jgi:AbiV family abortive infection protein|nr:AbiV family abortive infection protein [Bacteroidota bacterium]